MTVTIAHLSDVHLGPIVGFTPRYWNAKRVLGFINWRRNRKQSFRRDVLDRLVADIHAQRPDHIAISGDLINIGLPAEMAAAARWLVTVGPPESVSVIPGNHDIYTHMGGDPGIARWAGYLGGGGVYPYVRRIGRVALIGLNSAMPTPPFVAAGRLGGEQLETLATLLDQLRGEGAIRVVMIHHPPLPGQAKPRKALQDAAEFQALLARHGAELVIHGHNHRAMLSEVRRTADRGAIPVVGVPAASMAVRHPSEPLGRYNLYRIVTDAPGGAIEMIGRGLAAPDGPVVEIERRLLSGA